MTTNPWRCPGDKEHSLGKPAHSEESAQRHARPTWKKGVGYQWYEQHSHGQNKVV
jgi:hypothetical protein